MTSCLKFLGHINRWEVQDWGGGRNWAMSVFQDMGMFSVHQELYFVYLVTSSQARQSKEGQPVMDQSAGIKQICPSVVISDTQSFPLHRHIGLMLTFIPVWKFPPGLGRFGRKSHQCSVPCSPLSWALLTKVVVCSQGLISVDLPFSRELHLFFTGCSQCLLFPTGAVCEHPVSPQPGGCLMSLF